MIKRMSCNTFPDTAPVAYWTTLHEDDRMLAVLPRDSRRQARHKLRLRLAGNLLKALGGEMVALIHNQVAIIAHEIVDEAASDHALYHGYIKQAGWLCAATADPTNSARRHSKESGKTLDPLKLQLTPMYQYECIHSPLCNQPRGDHGLSERGAGCQHSGVFGEHGMCSNGLLRAQLTLECRFERQAGVALVPDHGLDVQIRQSLTDFIQATARESYVLGVILGTGNNPRLVVSGKPHGLQFVKLRILERRQPDQPIAESGRQRIFRNVYLIAEDEFQALRQRARD